MLRCWLVRSVLFFWFIRENQNDTHNKRDWKMIQMCRTLSRVLARGTFSTAQTRLSGSTGWVWKTRRTFHLPQHKGPTDSRPAADTPQPDNSAASAPAAPTTQPILAGSHMTDRWGSQPAEKPNCLNKSRSVRPWFSLSHSGSVGVGSVFR